MKLPLCAVCLSARRATGITAAHPLGRSKGRVSPSLSFTSAMPTCWQEGADLLRLQALLRQFEGGLEHAPNTRAACSCKPMASCALTCWPMLAAGCSPLLRRLSVPPGRAPTATPCLRGAAQGWATTQTISARPRAPAQVSVHSMALWKRCWAHTAELCGKDL